MNIVMDCRLDGYVKMVPDEDVPHVVHIIKTGWKDSYFVFTELGDMDDYDTVMLNKEEVRTKYGTEMEE